MKNALTPEYKSWLVELKGKIRSTQIKAAIAVNTALITFYWELGKSISGKENVWGSRFLESLSKDLTSEFPDMKGFSVSNLKTCRLFYNYFAGTLQFSSQAANQNETPGKNRTRKANLRNKEEQGSFNKSAAIFKIPWGHIKLIITKIKEPETAFFYVDQTLENNWSRAILDIQIASDLYSRYGKSINNFSQTLPKPLSDLANQTLKDPYIFDFLALDVKYRERDIEKQLINHITKFVLELGKGFAFIGNQYHLQVAENDYYLDLLFYHIKLKCYVVIELKNAGFKPEFTGKLNFYLSAVDSLVKDGNDNPTIGILLCKDKNNIEAEFALRDIKKPMGVSELRFTENLPENLKSSLPTIKELEDELKNIDSSEEF